MVLHCPEKEFLKRQLQFRHGDRLSVHDLAAEGKIAPGCLLSLSEDARKRKAKLLPNVDYKNIGERLKRFANSLKTLAQRVLEFRNRRIVKHSRAAKHPYGPITEKTPFEIEQDHPLSIIAEKAEKPATPIEPERKTEHKTSSISGVGAFAWMAEQKRLERAIEAQNETSADRENPPSLLGQVLRKMSVKREPEHKPEHKTSSIPRVGAFAWLAEQKRLEREFEAQNETSADRENPTSLLEQVLRKMSVKREPERPKEREMPSNPGNDALAWLAEQTKNGREKEAENEIPAVKEPSPSLPEQTMSDQVEHQMEQQMEQEQQKARPELEEIPEPEPPKKKSRGMDI